MSANQVPHPEAAGPFTAPFQPFETYIFDNTKLLVGLPVVRIPLENTVTVPPDVINFAHISAFRLHIGTRGRMLANAGVAYSIYERPNLIFSILNRHVYR
jgi:hypothetical protein